MKPHLAKRPLRRGFALVVTLSLMVLLAVVCVGLLGLSAVSLRSSTQEMAMAEAKANARMALMLAIGELQKAMGPDRRISARAETLAKHPAVGSRVPKVTSEVWWVGVAPSSLNQVTNPGGQKITWLVSGLKPTSSPAQQRASAG